MTPKYTRREIDEIYVRSFLTDKDVKNIDKFMTYVENYGVEIVYELYQADEIETLESHVLVLLSETDDDYIRQKYGLSVEVMGIVDAERAIDNLVLLGNLKTFHINTTTAFFEPKGRE